MAFKKLKLWFDTDLAKLLSEKLETVLPKFDSHAFIAEIDEFVHDLELKDRVELIADKLDEKLPFDYPKNVDILIRILGPENQEETGMFTNFYWVMPIAKYVEKYGLDDFDKSMEAIVEITKRNTSEFTIRPYIEKYPNRTMNQIAKWTDHDNFHIRRLASEGIRPRLPWAKKLQGFIDDPQEVLTILESMKDEETRFVQKSIANCLNDILKDNPEIAKQIIETWAKSATSQRRWTIRHAIRNYRKKQDPWAAHVEELLQTIS